MTPEQEFETLQYRLKELTEIERDYKDAVKHFTRELRYAKHDLNKLTKQRRQIQRQVDIFWKKQTQKNYRTRKWAEANVGKVLAVIER